MVRSEYKGASQTPDSVMMYVRGMSNKKEDTLALTKRHSWLNGASVRGRPMRVWSRWGVRIGFPGTPRICQCRDISSGRFDNCGVGD